MSKLDSIEKRLDRLERSREAGTTLPKVGNGLSAAAR